MQATARALTSLSAKRIGNIKHKMALSRELILKLDKAREDRLLTPPETWLYKTLKLSYLGYASLERTVARQRARIACLKDGDANTTFFHRQCSYRRQKNRIHSLAVDDQVLTEPSDMIAAAFSHFDGLIGSSVERDRTLNLPRLITPSDDLLELDMPFTDEEIWARWLHGRIPTRMLGYCEAGFFGRLPADTQPARKGILQAKLLTLLPKKPDAHALGDCRPISLIHLAAKVIAKEPGQ
jgi:hypothetical protein